MRLIYPYTQLIGSLSKIIIISELGVVGTSWKCKPYVKEELFPTEELLPSRYTQVCFLNSYYVTSYEISNLRNSKKYVKLQYFNIRE